MLNKTKKAFMALAVPAAALIAPAAALAQAGSNSLVPNDISPINNIVSIIRNAIRFILLVAFILAFVFLLLGGIRWITAGGDEKAVGSARGMITAALIGLVIVLVSYALIVLVETFFGVKIISQDVTLETLGKWNKP